MPEYAVTDADADEVENEDPRPGSPDPDPAPHPAVDPRPGRRVFLVAGAATVGAAIFGIRLGTSSPDRRTRDVQPGPSRVASTTPTPAPVPLLAPLPDPTPFVTFSGLSAPGVMQDFSYLLSARTFFVTQSTAGSLGRVDGSGNGYETLIINRVDASGTTVDAMTLIDGGHGLGIEADDQPGGPFVWVAWQGKTADSDWRENDFVRLRYTPGTWTRGQAVQQLGLTVLPVKDEPEAQYRFDWKNDWAVERHYDYNGATETYKRRRISDIRAGVMVPDDHLDRLPLPVDPPTTQGFTTIDDTFYRWLGTSTVENAIDPGDPITLQRYDWPTGQLLAEQTFTTVSRDGATWPGGKFEPEGMCMVRETGGAVTLLVGDTTGLPTHQHHVSAFLRITDA